MNKKTLPSFILLLLINVTVHSQLSGWPWKKGKSYDLTYNEKGKLISFPGIIMKSRDNICFKVAVSSHFIFSEMNDFYSRLKSTSEFFGIKINQDAYSCYFDGLAKFKFDEYLASLDKLIDSFAKFPFCDDTTTEQIIKSFKDVKEIPINAFLTNLFKNQFEIQVVKNDVAVKTIQLTADSFYCKDSCLYFTAKCTGLSDLICQGCAEPTDNGIQFRLMRTDPFTKTLQDWFIEKNKALLKIANFENIKKSLLFISATAKQHDLIVALMKSDSLDMAAKKAKSRLTLTKIDSIYFKNRADSLKGLLENTNIVSVSPINTNVELKAWFSNWLWYKGGKLVLDPYQTMTDEQVNSLNEQITGYDAESARIRQLKSFSDSVAAKTPQNIAGITLLRQIQDSTAMYNSQIDNLSKLKKKAQALLNNRSGDLPATQARFCLNDSKIILSSRKDVEVQKQFDAAQNYKALARTKHERDRVSEVPEDETVYMMIYNVDSSKTLDISEHRMDFNDIEHFTEVATKMLGDVASGMSAVGATGTFMDFIKSFVSLGTHGASTATAADCLAIPDNPVFSQIKALANSYSAGNSTIWYDDKNVNNVISSKEPTAALYQTVQRELGAGFKTPYTDTVSVSQTEKAVKKPAFVTYVNTGGLSYMRIAAGVAFTSHPSTINNVDTAGNGFRISTSDNRASPIIGFKIYPWLSYNRDRWLLPRYPLRRLSIFGGFEILHPLNNFYVGGCYDIVPGLGISVGTNIHLQTNYKIENNAITDTYRNYKFSGAYYSILVNPTLFGQFIKTFFK